MWVQSLGQEDLAWTIPWTEEPGGLQSMGSQWIRHDWATNTNTHTLTETQLCVFPALFYTYNQTLAASGSYTLIENTNYLRDF